MSINESLEELVSLTADAKRLPFTDSCIIHEADISRIVDDLRREMPRAIKNAEDVMREKQAILDEARREADEIVRQAKEYANKIVNENEITKQAQQKAQMMVEQAENQAITASQKITQEAYNYVNQMFDHLIGNTDKLVEGIQHVSIETDKFSSALQQVLGNTARVGDVLRQGKEAFNENNKQYLAKYPQRAVKDEENNQSAQ